MTRQDRPSTARATAPDEQTDEPPLSTAATDFMDAALTERRFLAASTLPAQDVKRLVRYLCCALAAAPAADLERALVQTAELRLRLRRTRAVLREIQGHTLSRTDPLAPTDSGLQRAFSEQAEDDSYAEIRTAWQEVMAEQLVASPRSRERWREQGWADIRSEVAAGIETGRAAWAAFTAYGRQWRSALALHAMTPALQRGSDTSFSAEPEGHKAGIAITDIECHIDSDGTLNIVVRIVTTSTKPTDTLLLSLRRDDDAWPLARGRRNGERVEWSLPDFGTAVGLPPGPLPAQFFVFDAADSPEPSGVDHAGVEHTVEEDPLSILAEVVDAHGQIIVGALAYVEIMSAPRWHTGQFSVQIVVPAFIRLAYPTSQLELALFVAEGHSQLLGTWPISQWDDAPLLLTAPFPGVPDTALPGTPIIIARLING
jgi:hypothetical protein